MKKIIMSFCLFIGAWGYTLAQDNGVDSKGQSVYNVYSKFESFNLKLSTDEPLAISKNFKTGTSQYFTIKRKNESESLKAGKLVNDEIPTVKKFYGISAKVSMLNSSEDYLDFKNFKPGAKFKLGFQTSIDTFVNLNNKFGANTWGGFLTYAVDNINVYDNVALSAGNRLPKTYGVETYFNWFLPNRATYTKIHVVAAFTASIKRTWNDDDLLNYQDVAASTITPAVVAFDEFKGRYGALRNDITKLRFSAALPFYLGYFNPIPYVVYNNNLQSSKNYHVGLFMNMLTKKLPANNFSIPSSIGLGVDWIRSAGSFSSANFVLKGTLSFGE